MSSRPTTSAPKRFHSLKTRHNCHPHGGHLAAVEAHVPVNPYFGGGHDR